MMHKAWSRIEEVPYCFSRSYIKFQGHKALKIVKFDPNWAFPDCNSSLNSPMAMKCCIKLETAKERCPIVFQGHPSNFKVTQYKISQILTQIGHFRTVGQSQLSNPSDLPCCSLHGSNDFEYNIADQIFSKLPTTSSEILQHVMIWVNEMHHHSSFCYCQAWLSCTPFLQICNQHGALVSLEW